MATIHLGVTPGQEYRAIDVGEGAPTYGAPIGLTVDMAEVPAKQTVVLALRALTDFLLQNAWPLEGSPVTVEVVDFSAWPSAAALKPGATVQAAGVTVLSDGTVSAAGVTWSTSDAGIATVSGGGLITAIGAGTATITATTGSNSDTIAVTVTT